MSDIIIDPEKLALKELISNFAVLSARIPEDQEEAHTVIAGLLEVLCRYQMLVDFKDRQNASLKTQLDSALNRGRVIT